MTEEVLHVGVNKDLYMFGVNMAKADSGSEVYADIQKAIQSGIILKKENIRIVCTAISEPRIATGPWSIHSAEEVVSGDHSNDQITGVVFNTGHYDLSTVNTEERMSFMKGAMEKFGKLALYEPYHLVPEVICKPNYYYIVADLNYKFRLKFDFEKESPNENKEDHS